MKKIIIGIIIIAIAVIAIMYFKSAPSAGVTQISPAPPATEPAPTTIPAGATVIHMTDAGFSPNEVTIKKGATVTFVSDSGHPHWPASAIHPTHTVYPGSDIQKCGTSEQTGIFDACRGLAPGESWSFTFDSVGTWRFHDHLQASLFGKVIVTP